ncbi:TetR/AcrR family transcriptional regulator [Kaistia geumhonensis]|uniref:AcrR family transcriptional regulator n=1 Tax=Kaistia geumhonensis TaxID=410839 RepID=A0ABU0M6I6_9HYPH|nr:TetR/AcrR family transcriptional regulator [Kaistia geumhonensis]MCX5478208.1 TetR/AcrR family transcriptional regulator [Kaistia geumhonensis]MDQ0516576.1 AcrR family transcriptional regulator [Kaistia geumhonensis]
MEPAPDKTSRTQEERTSATRARLVEATLDLLLSKGYAGTTTVDIAARAGLTRGALAHHYSGKDELVVEAFDRHLTIVTQEIRTYATLVRDGSLSLDDFIDRVWTIFSGRFFMLTLEEVTAARHNDFLRVRLVARTRDFHDSLDAIWRHFFDETGLNPLEIEVMLNATLCLLRGMGVQTVLRDDPVYFRRLLRFWKSILKEQIKAATTAAAGSKGKAE